MKKMKCDFLLLMVLFLVVALSGLFSCSTRHTASRSPKHAEDKPYRLDDEGQVPPLSENTIEKAADIEELSVPEDEVLYEEVEPQVDSSFVQKPKPPAKPPTKEGFRVQVFAALSALSAEEVKRSFADEFSIPAYVDFVDGMYKVRLGDFLTRPEAKTFLIRCKEAGYDDAWIVLAPVKAPKEE